MSCRQSRPTPPAAPSRPYTRAAAPRSLVVTLGAAGAVCVEADGDPVHLPSPRVPVVDTTGAGDAFAGALAWRLARG
ncbi:MAG: hypothetical protein HOV68_21460, partial [Streptomycetaceae bacterium]|nr:hypothetical protein [Streptomycetaceae bacterium]